MDIWCRLDDADICNCAGPAPNVERAAGNPGGGNPDLLPNRFPDTLALSAVVCISADYPRDGYPWEIVSIAVDKLIAGHGDDFIQRDKKTGINDFSLFKKATNEIMVDHIKETLAMMGVEFDSWFNESSLYEKGNFEKTIEDLKKRDLVYELR